MISSLMCEQHRMETELKENKRRTEEMEIAFRSVLPSLVQVRSKGACTVDKEMSFSNKHTLFSSSVISILSQPAFLQAYEPLLLHGRIY